MHMQKSAVKTIVVIRVETIPWVIWAPWLQKMEEFSLPSRIIHFMIKVKAWYLRQTAFKAAERTQQALSVCFMVDSTCSTQPEADCKSFQQQ